MRKIKNFKLFEQSEPQFEIEFKSNLSWYNKHSKIWTKEEDDELIKLLKEEIEKMEDFNNAPKNDEVDPYGEEEWRDDFIYQHPFFRNSTNKIVAILAERLKLLRSFKK
jgi:hypothetical protein